MSVTAVVPVWNNRALLERLFASLDRQTTPAAEVIAVDNGSTDGARELAREHGARVIEMGTNRGFAPAVNRGIRECRSEWVAVLNTDVELAPDYLERLMEAVSARDAWFATGKILSAGAESLIDGTEDAICRGGTAWRVGSRRPDGPLFSFERLIWSPPWTAAVFRTGLFHHVGLLDERFESYLEDVEFGMRCALAGFSGLYVPAARAWHKGSASLGPWNSQTVRRISRNQVWLLAMHYPSPLLRRFWRPILAAHLLWGAVAVRHGAGLAWLAGKWEGLRNWSTIRVGYRPHREDAIAGHLLASESVIREIQDKTFLDSYWRMYFLLTRTGAK